MRSLVTAIKEPVFIVGGSRQEAGASRDRREGGGAEKGQGRPARRGRQPRDPCQTLETRVNESHHLHGYVQELTHDFLGCEWFGGPQGMQTQHRGGGGERGGPRLLLSAANCCP